MGCSCLWKLQIQTEGKQKSFELNAMQKNYRSVINSNGMGVRNLIGTAHFLAATTNVVRSFFIYGPRTKLDINPLMDDKSDTTNNL